MYLNNIRARPNKSVGWKMTGRFENDLRDCCKAAAEFLRAKNVDWNKKRKKDERSYSGEREFVAELYHLMVMKNESYRTNLFVDYLRPDESEKNEKAVPDLVYRNGPNEKSVVEIKAPVNYRANGDPEPLNVDLYGSDGKGGINGDYNKLKEHYSEFKSKFLVVAYLGDMELEKDKEVSIKAFADWMDRKFPGNDEIKVIVC
jgi:hypothetical protein